METIQMSTDELLVEFEFVIDCFWVHREVYVHVLSPIKTKKENWGVQSEVMIRDPGVSPVNP